MRALRIEPSDDLVLVAFKVCTALHQAGMKVVLTGGSASTVYAPMACRSMDVDFIATFVTSRRDFEQVLAELGYLPNGRIYSCPGQIVTLDIPDDRILIGSTETYRYETLHRDGLILNILTPTDCVRDRLCGYYFWGDTSSLNSALQVANLHTIDLALVEAWSKEEGELEKFQTFQRRLELMKRNT